MEEGYGLHSHRSLVPTLRWPQHQRHVRAATPTALSRALRIEEDLQPLVSLI